MDVENRLNLLQQRLESFVKEYRRVQKENARLKQLLAQNEKAETQREAQVQELQQQLEILKFAAGEMDAKDKKAFEKRLNQYIRDVEKCIAVLSE